MTLLTFYGFKKYFMAFVCLIMRIASVLKEFFVKFFFALVDLFNISCHPRLAEILWDFVSIFSFGKCSTYKEQKTLINILIVCINRVWVLF